MNYYLAAFKKYAVFDGRAQRAEYWYFALVNFVIYAILGYLGNVGGLLAIVFALAVLIPSIAVGIRRLHDIDYSGWWVLIGLIPIVGTIWLLVLLVLDGTPGPNKYGPNPKGAMAAPATPATPPTSPASM